MLGREGWRINHKRVQRVWRNEGLHVPRKRRRPKRAARTPGSITATHPNQIWALDFVFDQTRDGRPLKILNITDEYTREALCCTTRRRITSDIVVTELDRITTERGTHPTHIRCDNGPELIAKHLHDWAHHNQIRVHYIEPGAPWQNAYIESFNGHLRREHLDLEVFNTLLEAQLLIEDWRHHYNQHRPHQSLNYQTPAEYAATCQTTQHTKTP